MTTVVGKRKTMIARVLSEKMEKTVIVVVETRKPHPLYKKVVKHIKKYKVNDEARICHRGDVVRIEETRPLSKEKRYRVVEILRKSDLVEVEPEPEKGSVETNGS